MSEALVLVGIAVAAVSGVPDLILGLRFGRVGRWGAVSRPTATAGLAGQRLAALLAVIGAALGLAGIGTFWATGDSHPIVRPWPLPGAEFHVALDGLSTVFLLPIFLISLLCNIYGLGYWRQTEHPHNGRRLRLFYGILTAGMAIVVIACNSVLFLFAWEMMALSAFFLVATEDHKKEVREASWIYLVATHIGTLCLFALFAILRSATGSYTLAPLASDSLPPATATAAFILAVVGFGLKAGIMPLHVWLPSSHAIAPSHVSAILSGVIIKMGIYGLVRATSLLPDPPPEWGTAVLLLGVVSGVLGVAFAIGQHDLKRLLAYHSIENIGIIIIGLGLAMLGRSLGRMDWVVLGLSGALLHVWNHALFKALLFLSAGSVIHVAHTREIDHLGGLARRMPWTGTCFLVGAIAICGLPPLNGFVSEFLIYLGLFSTLGNGDKATFAGVAFAAPALALIGALAVACFVKVFGVVFLGTPRTEHAEEAHESPVSMTGPMVVLVACCIFIGLAPVAISPIMRSAVRVWAPDLSNGPELTALAPLDWISLMGVLLVAGLILGSAVLWWRLRHSVVETAVTWGCGYAAPTPRMQYTASSFAQMVVGSFAWALRPRSHKPHELPLFPPTLPAPPLGQGAGRLWGQTEFHSETPEVVLDEAVLPAFRKLAWLCTQFRVFQQRSVQAYLFYIFLALIALLLWR
jgi:hydrogenase-4 component B